MKKQGAAAFVAVTLVLALSACTADSDSRGAGETEAAPVSAETVATESPSPEPTASPTEDSIYGATVKNDRGNSVKTVGQLAGLHSALDVPVVQWRITGITPNFACTQDYAEASANGNFIALDLEVTTTPELASQESTVFLLSEYDFSVISPEGTTENDSQGNGYLCLSPSERLPSELGPGEHAVGKIVLDSAQTSGSIMLRFPGQSTGWEWAF